MTKKMTIDIPEDLIRQFADEKFIKLEEENKKLKKENNNLKAKIARLDATQLKKERKVMEEQLWKAENKWREMMEQVLEAGGFHISDYELDYSRVK